jgi:hypothetical protein
MIKMYMGHWYSKTDIKQKKIAAKLILAVKNKMHESGRKPPKAQGPMSDEHPPLPASVTVRGVRVYTSTNERR